MDIWACVGGSGERDAGKNPTVSIWVICGPKRGEVCLIKEVDLLCSTQEMHADI